MSFNSMYYKLLQLFPIILVLFSILFVNSTSHAAITCTTSVTQTTDSSSDPNTSHVGVTTVPSPSSAMSPHPRNRLHLFIKRWDQTGNGSSTDWEGSAPYDWGEDNSGKTHAALRNVKNGFFYKLTILQDETDTTCYYNFPLGNAIPIPGESTSNRITVKNGFSINVNQPAVDSGDVNVTTTFNNPNGSDSALSNATLSIKLDGSSTFTVIGTKLNPSNTINWNNSTYSILANLPEGNHTFKMEAQAVENSIPGSTIYSVYTHTETHNLSIAPPPTIGNTLLAFTFAEDAGGLNVTVDYSGGITVQDVLLEWQRPSDVGYSVLDGPLTINGAMPSRTWSHTSLTDLQDLPSGTYNFKVTLNLNDKGVIYPIRTESNVIVQGDPLSFQLVEENFGEVGVFVMANETSVTSVDLQIKGPAEGTDPDTYRFVRTASPDPDSTATENYFRWGTLQVNDTAASEADLGLNILGDLQGGTYTVQARAEVPDPVDGTPIEVIKEFEITVGGTRLQYRYVQKGDAPADIGIEIWYESADVQDASSYVDSIYFVIDGPKTGFPKQIRPDDEGRYLWGILNASGTIDEASLTFNANGNNVIEPSEQGFDANEDGDTTDVLPGVDTQLQNLPAGIYTIDVTADVYDETLCPDDGSTCTDNRVEQTFEFEVFANEADAPGLSCEDEEALKGNVVEHFKINASLINDPGTNLLSSGDDTNDIGIKLEVDRNFINVANVQNVALHFTDESGIENQIGILINSGNPDNWVWGQKPRSVNGYLPDGTPVIDPNSNLPNSPNLMNIPDNVEVEARVAFVYEGNNYQLIERIYTDGPFGDRMGKDPGSLIGAVGDPCAVP